MAQKVGLAAALVTFTYYPAVEDGYSADHLIFSSLLDRISSRYSVVENEHILLFYQ